MWSTHVWNMFDFAADARDQGGEPGMNHKGLMTFDRKVKKRQLLHLQSVLEQRAFRTSLRKPLRRQNGSSHYS